MPYRLTPLITNQIYHIFNRGVEKRDIFSDDRSRKRFLDVLTYYRTTQQPFKYTNFLKLNLEDRAQIQQSQIIQPLDIKLLGFVLMPNHYHLLLEQMSDGGISMFMKKSQDSYTKYFNTKNERIGPLFQGSFKAIRIESDEQLLHILRYIHLNPFTAYMIKEIEDLIQYKWSSLPEYLNNRNIYCNTNKILSFFKTLKSFKSFTFDQADYQKELALIKHIAIDES